MKKWIWILAILAIIVAVYYDLSRGSLPVVGSEETTVQEQVDDEEAEDLDEDVFYDDTVAIEVEPGQSLLTIIEQLHEDGYDEHVDHVKSDFEYLNDGILSDEIRAGDVYTFPIYETNMYVLLRLVDFPCQCELPIATMEQVRSSFASSV